MFKVQKHAILYRTQSKEQRKIMKRVQIEYAFQLQNYNLYL
ncbi:unnamed protein product [Paramecium octaurelia]|uniref:Uncharacterized protein n=1 Tax=Paramecium octaurelia TaxID=43137 RepID=A0A8S1XVY4_PAROT|nr:unnamed protein product [Paramecium octaurelia]